MALNDSRVNRALPPASLDEDAPPWTRTLYTLLAEKEHRSGSRRTVEGYARMLWPFFAKTGGPDAVTPAIVLRLEPRVDASGREPSSTIVGATSPSLMENRRAVRYTPLGDPALGLAIEELLQRTRRTEIAAALRCPGT